MSGRTSVVIPCYKEAGYLPQALDSVARQISKAKEVIVIDDGSPQPIAKPNNWDGPPLRWLRTPNRGLGSARNTGIAVAEGEFVAFLDADDFWDERKLEMQESLLDTYPEAVACYTRCRRHAGFFAFGPYPAETEKKNQLAKRLWYAQFFPPSSVLARLNEIRKANGFREGLRNGEDLDFWFRLFEHGEIYGVPEELTWYRIHENQITQDPVRRVMGSRETRREIIERFSHRLVAAGIAESKFWDAYRQEILSVYFRRDFRSSRIMIADYLRRHPTDLPMFKYLLVSLLPEKIVRSIRGQIGTSLD